MSRRNKLRIDKSLDARLPSAAEAADRLQAIDHKHRAAIEKLTRRLEAVRPQLDGFKAAKRR